MTKTILIVEDDEQVRHSLTNILEEVGYSVVEASNGKEVLQDLKRSADFCLLLTDIAMPDMEGLELITHLRRHHPKLPIVAMSGTFEGKFLNAARLLGAKETLQKPFNSAPGGPGICLSLTIIIGALRPVHRFSPCEFKGPTGAKRDIFAPA